MPGCWQRPEPRGLSVPTCAAGKPRDGAGARGYRHPSHHLITSPPLFSQVCNCDKYLKVPKERMRQLVEDSRHSLGDSSTGERAPRGGRAEICIPLLTRGCVHRISPR